MLTIHIDLINAREALRNHIDKRPTISGRPGFNPLAHISAMTEWLKTKDDLEITVSVLEDIYDPDAKVRRASTARRRRMWMFQHYPGGVHNHDG